MEIPDKEKLYLDYYPRVLGYIKNRITLRDDAEDIAQTVFLKVFSKLDSFDESKSSVSTWIFNIMKNTLIDYQRRCSNHPESEIPETMASEEEDMSDTVVREEELSELADALEKLCENERDIVILHYYSGYTLMKAADMMGLSYGQAKRLHAKAIEKLSVLMNR